MVQSYKHGGRLLAAALGQSSKNASLVKSKALKTPDPKIASISASELLKQKNEEFLAKKREMLKKRKLDAALAQEKKGEESGTSRGLTPFLRGSGFWYKIVF